MNRPAFEYNAAHLADAHDRADDLLEDLDRLIEYVLSMGMADTHTSFNLNAARGGIVAAQADISRRITFL